MKKILGTLIMIITFFFTTFSFANAQTSYIYYWGQGCPHCANVDKYFKGVDAIDKIDIDKREVYFNKDNALKMSEDTKRLGKESAGVPFLIINEDGVETYLSGDKSIIDYFIPSLGEAPENNNKVIVFIILGLLTIIIPFMIIKGGKK